MEIAGARRLEQKRFLSQRIAKANVQNISLYPFLENPALTLATQMCQMPLTSQQDIYIYIYMTIY